MKNYSDLSMFKTFNFWLIFYQFFCTFDWQSEKKNYNKRFTNRGEMIVTSFSLRGDNFHNKYKEYVINTKQGVGDCKYPNKLNWKFSKIVDFTNSQFNIHYLYGLNFPSFSFTSYQNNTRSGNLLSLENRNLARQD